MYNATKNSRLIAGLVDKAVEFFVHRNEVYCVHDGRTYVFEEIPRWIIDIVEHDMLKHEDAIKALALWENLADEDYIRQYIICRFGGIDDEPDIDTKGVVHEAEYFDCGLRGTCKHEGKLCTAFKVANGYLTKMELAILKLINLPDKIIADRLSISTETVSTHQQNIRIKTGLKSKVELAIFAQKKGII
ncbi:response regulator transcription factor [Pedobacter nototheniae]|uniref:response regulator transcription factor n=1 Tax=Pedobacter nototheniae TaxID=2488994 RepID=UPI00103AE4E9|nr:helix-turn-helix transcriptional regulator [Pedobacter nototheniae]